MTGEHLKEWMLRNEKSREEIAFRLKVTTNTLFRWFKRKELPIKAVYALEKLGCVEPSSHEPLVSDGHSG